MRRRSSLGLVLLLAAIGGSWAFTDDSPAADLRPVTVLVEARGMAFLMPSGNSPDATNPTLELPAGARVRLVFHNRDPGVVHDFSVEGLEATSGLVAPGESAVLEFVAPEAGELTYECVLHGQMMQGLVVIRG